MTVEIMTVIFEQPELMIKTVF